MPRIRLAVFDVDGVLVPIYSSWEYLHKYFGSVEQARVNLELYRRGLINYYEWMRLDTLAWIRAAGRRIHRSEIEEAFRRIGLVEGAEEAIESLKRAGIRVALLSGGIDVLVSRVAREIGADAWIANHLVFDDDGYLVPGGIPFVEALGKDRALRDLAQGFGIPIEETAFIGDSHWDAPAFREAGVSVLLGSDDPGVEVDHVVEDIREVPRLLL